MKMTRNRMLDNFNALLGLVLLGLFAGLTAGPALAQAAGGETVSIELNKLEPQGSACRTYLVVKHTGEEAFDFLNLDLVMLERGGVVAKRLGVHTLSDIWQGKGVTDRVDCDD